MSSEAADKPFTILQVTGITCLDCAQKFERAVSDLPGVIQASLNAVTGKLRIEGKVDLTTIQSLGEEEDYTISIDTASPKSKITIFKINGITCLDCARKFEKAVNDLPGVCQATLNTMTGKLKVEGEADLKAIRELGKEEDYMVAIDAPASIVKTTVYQVDGITCLDCAQKFEKAVHDLPGVVKASLNAVTGALTVEGVPSLMSIQNLGREEGYTISSSSEAAEVEITPKIAAKPNWELYRTILSGLTLVCAYGLDKFSAPAVVFIPLYIAATVLGGWGNFKKAARALRRFNFNMSVLMSVAVVGAFAIGQYEEGASVAFLYAISEMLEAWTMEKARTSIRDLMDIAPKAATVRRGDSQQEIPVEEILIGDVMLIRPGEKIAMDGVIVKGESAVNQAAITGESVPVEKAPGAEVFAGTLNTFGSLEVEVTKLIQDTTIARIIHMVEQAQSKRAPSQAFVERFAAVYTPIVMVLAVGIIFIPPLFLGGQWTEWIYRGLALMVVSCPCALVVSTPVAVVSAISNAARNGVLIKGGLYLEEAGALQAIAFDKTGTLTKGKPGVTDIVPISAQSENGLLAMAAGLEERSEHPLAQAIVREAKERQLSIRTVEDFTALVGRGAKGTIDGETVYIGNMRLFSEIGLPVDPVVAEQIEQFQSRGKTVMLVGSAGEIFGLVAMADEVRDASAAMMASLKAAGIRHTVMLTGDNSATAGAIAEKLGIHEFHAELLPQDKVGVIETLLTKHGKVAMIGDGINDAPALAMSTIGIAMGGAGTDTALETADIVLMADDLAKLPFTIQLSRAALGIIRQNISFSLVIKILAVVAVFPGWLTLWLAILADMGATLLVTLNSLRLLRIKVKK